MLFTSTAPVAALYFAAIASASFHPKMSKQTKRNACGPGNGLSARGFCTPCNAGTYSTSGTCIPAPLGNYVHTSGSSQYFPCAAGTRAEETGLAMCLRCSPMMFSIEGASSCYYCKSGQSSIDRVSCVSCKTGSFSSYGEACQLCPKGSISTKVGSKVCAQCPANTYSEVMGGMGCLACPSGLFSAPGSTAKSQCTKGYVILVTSTTFTKLGYLAKNYGSEFMTSNYDIYNNALIVNMPTSLPSLGAVNLVATTAHPAGSNVVIALGNSPYSRTFASTTDGFAWLSAGAQSDSSGFFSTATDYNTYLGKPTSGDGLGESKVWRVGTFDSGNGRYPLTFDFVDQDSKSVTNADVFADHSSGRNNYLGISASSSSQFASQKVLLFLIPIL